MKTIVIDPGHGGYDYGAVNGNRYEKNDNLRMGLAVRDRLANAGQRVIMTRTTDTFVDLLDRSRISNNNNTDLFISLHRNAFTDPAANGWENFVQINSPVINTTYAKTVLDEAVNVGVQSNRGVKQADFSVLRNTRAPAQLLEMGFISNDIDNIMFDQRFDQYADAIARGILLALGEPLTPPSPPASGNQIIKNIQNTLNQRYNTGLVADGISGPKTKSALVKGLQTELNRQYNANLLVDGVFGPKTRAAIPNLSIGVRGNITWLLQAALFLKGYSDVVPDGVFGSITSSAVRRFQAQNGLNPDGIAGPFTFEMLFR